MAQKFKSMGIEQAIEVMEVLAKDEYSPLWWVIGDFTVNGHKISVGDSTLWHHIIVDNGYVNITGNYGINDYQDEKGVWHLKTVSAMEYLRMKLEKDVCI